MTDQRKPRLYLCIEFDWPEPIEKEVYQAAYNLHKAVEAAPWIHEVMAGTRGIGSPQQSSWIFMLDNHTALDRLLYDETDTVNKAYNAFFNAMRVTILRTREEVWFA